MAVGVGSGLLVGIYSGEIASTLQCNTIIFYNFPRQGVSDLRVSMAYRARQERLSVSFRSYKGRMSTFPQ